MYRHPALRAACLAFTAMLLLTSPCGTNLIAGGQQARTLTRFSDGSPEAAVYFPDTGGSGRACLTLPRNAHITSAREIVVEVLQGIDRDDPDAMRPSQ